MDALNQTYITPEQIAAIEAGHGFARAEDPGTRRVFLILEQGPAPTLSNEYFQGKIAEGLAESDRGESKPWNVEELKADLRRRNAGESASL